MYNLKSYKNHFTKQIVLTFILVVSSLSGYAQSGVERKQLFDYDWKFFLGDASEAKANDFNDNCWVVLLNLFGDIFAP